MDALPVNVALLGKGNTVSAERRCGSSCAAGAGGFKLHEDWGTTPAAIDACLTRGRRAPACRSRIHTDTLNEAGFVEDTLAAIAGRAIHAYHTEGAGRRARAGHHHRRRAPERAARRRPTRPGRTPCNTLDEHLDMLMVCHHLNSGRARGPGVRREPDPAVHDRRRGPAARPRRDLDDRLGLAGDGPGRRGRPAHLADRARDEAPRAARCRATAPPTTSGPAGTSPSTRSARPSPTASTARSARSSRASSPTWCSGTRRSSASGRTWSSRAA